MNAPHRLPCEIEARNGCDEERGRIRQSIAARVERVTDGLCEEAARLQKAYEQRRRAYLKELYGEYPRRDPETAHTEATPEESEPTPADGKLLL